MSLITKATVGLDQFTISYIPIFRAKDIPFGLIEKPRAYSSKQGTVSIFWKEFAEDFTFFSFQGKVYHLTKKLQESDFKKQQVGFSPSVLVSFTEDNWSPIKPELMAGLLGTPSVPDFLEPNKSYIFEETVTHGGVEMSGHFDTTPLEKETSVKPMYPQVNNKVGLGIESTFDQFVESRANQIIETNRVKGVQYRRGGKVWHNFDSIARMNDTTPEKALWELVSKQIINTKDMIADLDSGILPDPKILQDVLKDIPMYMILLEGMFIRRFEQQESLPIQKVA